MRALTAQVRAQLHGKEGDFPTTDEYCVHLGAHAGCWGPPACNVECYATESTANNFRAIRQVVTPAVDGGLVEAAASPDRLYAEFATGDQSESDVEFAHPDFYELYDMATDEWHQRNVYASTPNATREELHARLAMWFACAGSECP